MAQFSAVSPVQHKRDDHDISKDLDTLAGLQIAITIFLLVMAALISPR